MKNKVLTKIARFFGKGTLSRRDVKSAPITEKFERCVMCGKLTDVPVSTPVDFREEEYEVGCGQLCNSCRLKLREETETGCHLSTVQILKAVEQSRTDNKNDG